MIWLGLGAVIFFALGFGVTLALMSWGLTDTSYPDQWDKKNRP
jgi:hypothetical protein